ncbi:MAG TPA: sodium:calcium antiporter [Selenomonadales bacterium]|nr:sodium:calcium antiporter [Selenomonadales bacterium]
MLLSLATLILAAVLIYISCELFVNGIEWVGRKFNIADSAVGTVLAAFGTALPESVVTFMAVAFGASAHQKDIGVGAALGGPLILSTVAYAVVGWSIKASQPEGPAKGGLAVDGGKLARDQLWFLSIFAANALLGLVAFPGKKFAAIVFVAAYAWYCLREMRSTAAAGEKMLEPLKFRPRQRVPETGWVLGQTFAALGLIFIGSQLFVNRLELISASFGIAPHMISLLLSPLATELPETLNAVIWVRQGKVGLALSNISGSMMVQATIPSALGIYFTPWRFDEYLILSVAVTMLSISFLWLTLKRGRFSAGRLSYAALFYLVFAVAAYLCYNLSVQNLVMDGWFR